jgi:hypothetical protein
VEELFHIMRIVYARCKVFIKALSTRAKTEFPAAIKQSGWAPEKPISDSSDPKPDPLVGGSRVHEICELFATKQHRRFMANLVQKETVKTQAKQRAEAKKSIAEQNKIAHERTANLRKIRAEKKQKAMEGVQE